jgi:hypothetical protein
MSAEALPSEVVFDLPSSLVPHRTYEYRANPSNANNFTTEGATIQFTLPRLDRSFYQANTIYVRGRLALTLAGTASTDVSDPNLSFTSAGAYALFSRQVVRTGSGQAIETIQNPAIITNIQMAYALTPAERQGMNNMLRNTPFYSVYGAQCSSAGWAMGTSSQAGHNTTVDFCIPLNSILTNCEKFLPASYDEFVIELTIANMISAAGVQNPTFIIHKDVAGITGFTLSDLEICAQVFELSPQTYNQLMAQYPQGISLKSQSYMYGSGSLAASSGAGTYDIVYSHKLQSIKQFIMSVAPTNAIEGPLYAGVNPNLNTYNLSINGVTYPQRPIRCVNPAETYAQNQKSWGALMSDLKCGSVVPEHHAVASTAYNTLFSAYLTYGALGARDLADMIPISNRAFFCLDLESINGSKNQVFNGVSTSGSGTSSVIRLEVGAALAANVHNVHYFSVYDCLIKFDPQLGVSVVN